jgi:thioredoxin 1
MRSPKGVSRFCLVVFGSILAALCFSCGKSSENKSELPRILTIGEVTTAIDGARDSLVAFDLYADWCGPCKVLEPVLDKIAAAYKGKVLFYRINIDQIPEAAQKFGVTSIPKVVFMKNGSVAASLIGLQPEEAYVDVIKRFSEASGMSPAAK